MNSQITTKPAIASIRLSAPNPISAIEPAAIPAPSAIANSTKCQAMPPQASKRARRSSLSLSALPDAPSATERTSDVDVAELKQGTACSDTDRLRRSCGARSEHGVEKRPAFGGERVHHHLPVSPRADDAVRAKRAHVMRDESLCPLDDPGEITDAQLVRPEQRGGKRQPGWIAERVRLPGGELAPKRIKALYA